MEMDLQKVFLHVDDLSKATLLLMKNLNQEIFIMFQQMISYYKKSSQAYCKINM